jgi:hypothetical protein
MADKLDSTKKNAKSINALLADQNKLIKEQLRIIKDQAGIDSERLNEQQDISNVLKDQIKSLKFQKAERLSILKSVNSITKVANQNYVTGQNELGTLKGISKLQKDRVGIEADIRNLINARKKIVIDSKSLSIEDQKVQMDIAGSIKDQVDEAVRLKENLIDVEPTAKKINKNFGVKSFGVLADVMKKVPGLSALSEPFSTAADGAREMASGIENAAKGGGKGLTKERIKQLGLEKQLGKLSGTAAAQKLKGMSSMRKGMLALRAGFATLGPVIAAALGPAILIAEMLKALVASDKAAGDMAKSMNITYADSVRTRAELTQMASSQLDITNMSKGNATTTAGLQETLLSVNKTLGTSTMLSEEMLVQFTQMRKMAGFTNEELMGIASISLATGKDMEAITGEFMAQATISASQNGVLLNEKDLLKDIGKVSAATTLSFGKNPKLIGEAVATAKALGMEMSKVEGIADSLLDFESSIENELQAELLLGKDINLEKARQAALNNDLATVAREISNQIGDSAEFSKMNRIQQEALAKSVGMNREDLAQTLFVQEQLVGATGEQAEKKEELINASIKAIGLEATQKKLAEDGVKGLQNQQSQAERLANTMDKLKEVFVSVAEPILAIGMALTPVVELIGFLVSGIMSISGAIGGALGSMREMGVAGAILGGILAVMAAAAAFFALSIIPVVGPALGIAAGLAIIGAYAKAVTSTESAQPAGDMFSAAKGKTMVSPAEGGLFELSDNDEFAAAPGLGQMLGGGGNTNTIVENKTNMNETNKLLSQLVKKTPEMAPLGLYEVQ